MNKITELDGINLKALAAIQQLYAIIILSGRIWGIDIELIGQLIQSGRNLSFFPRTDLALIIKRYLREHFPDADAKAVIKDFFIHPKTVCFLGLEFNPKNTTEGYLNSWTGPIAKPNQGSWKTIKYYLLEIICHGDTEAFDYLFKYLAHALQKPEEKPGIFIILLGGQGIGKGTLARILKAIWGPSFKIFSKMNSVTGNFNSAIENAFFIFLDEAFFHGDRRLSDSMKSLVTEPELEISEKHQPSRQMPSYHRYIAATNQTHVKHTERDDRRDFVLRVSDRHQNDHDFWDAIYHEIGNGGIEAFMFDLLAADLTDFNVRQKPKTRELATQKLLSLEPIQAWWYEVLNNSVSDDWDDFVTTDEVIKGVTEHTGKRLYKPPTAMEIGHVFKLMCPSAVKKQRMKFSSRSRGFVLPGLKEARKEFALYLDADIEWENLPEEQQETPKSINGHTDDEF